jgi:hypothetical protein
MVGEYVRSLEGIAMLGVIGLVASFALFIGIVVYVMRRPAPHIDAMAQLPFDDEHPVSLQPDEVVR